MADSTAPEIQIAPRAPHISHSTNTNTESVDTMPNRRGRRGRGGGRGGSNRPRDNNNHNDAENNEERREDGQSQHHGRGRGRSGQNNRGGRGRGDRSGGNRQARGEPHQSVFGEATGKLANGKEGQEEPHQQPLQNGETKSAIPEDPDVKPIDTDDDNICFICAEPVFYWSIAPCNHRTCHICSLRMRALYKNRQCPHCRTESSFVIFTTDENKPYEDFADNLLSHDDVLGIKYDELHIREDTTLLLRFNCPDSDCTTACLGWPSLHKHVKDVHNRHLCDLCSRFKKVFTHEHTLFSDRDLKRHERYGDDQPGSETQSGFRGHPECEFCRRRFYGSDELFQHCKQDHERCFVCDRENPNRPLYFQNYNSLEDHFRNDHFLCPDNECMARKFVVFGSEIDLKAHQVEEHPNGLSKTALREARRIDMANFQEAHIPRGRGGRNRGNRDHRRDPQAPEPPPPPTDVPLRRDERAFQRTLAVQSAQSTTRRTFGGQLTAPDPPSVTAPAATAPSQPASVFAAAPADNNPQGMVIPVATRRPGVELNDFPELSRLDLRPRATPIPRAGSPLPPPPTNSAGRPVDAATQAKHVQVLDRAGFLLKHDERKMESFKKYVSNFRQGKMSGMDIIDAFWSLFDMKAVDLAKLIRELAELYDDPAKTTELRTAWNAWRASNEDYPAMVGAATAAAQATLGHAHVTTSRLQGIKRSTQKNLHAGSSPWMVMSTSRLANSSGSLANVNAAGPSSVSKPRATPWAGAAGASATTSSRPMTPVMNTGGSSAGPKGGSKMEFPALPMKGPSYAPVPRKHEGVAPASVWAGGSGGAVSGGGGYQNNNYDDGDDVDQGTSTKKKGKKKQVLMQFG